MDGAILAQARAFCARIAADASARESFPLSKVRQQYLELKKRYPNAILFFQLGDFYETFAEDAHIVSDVCSLVLTSREMGRGHRWPLAGLPVHAADNYIAKLLKAGHRVAICQQIEDAPAKGATIVQREVVRVVTPGTVVEPNLLDDRANNYLAVVALDRERVGLAYADVTTGEFAVTQIAGAGWEQTLRGELERVRPAEVLVAYDDKHGQGEADANQPLAEPLSGHTVTPYEDWHFHLDTAREALLAHFAVASLEGFGCAGLPAAVRSAGALVQYLQDTQRGALARLAELRTYTTSAYMALDAATRRNLEITQAGRAGGAQGSLLAVLDKTVTPMGGRLLRRWLGQPLLDLPRLQARQAVVAAMVADNVGRAELIALLRRVGDVERLASRVTQRIAGPRDLVALRRGLGVVPDLARLLSGPPAEDGEGAREIAQLVSQLDACPEVAALVDQALVAEPPANVGDGGVIKPGLCRRTGRASRFHPRRPRVDGRPGEDRARTHRGAHAEGRLQQSVRLLHRGDQCQSGRAGRGGCRERCWRRVCRPQPGLAGRAMPRTNAGVPRRLLRLHAQADPGRRRALHHLPSSRSTRASSSTPRSAFTRSRRGCSARCATR